MQEKSLSQRIEESPGEERILLSNEDKNKISKTYGDEKEKLNREIGNLRYFLYGILLGVLGSYIATVIYDFFRETDYFFIINSIFFIIFIVGVYKLISKLFSSKYSLKSSEEQEKVWINADL